jgi:uncharacterized protein YdeI (BOF family)
MSTIKTIAIAAALFVGASSLAMAQGSPGQSGNPANNAAASGGSGTHHGSMKTGSAASTKKFIKNQNGYRGRNE